jgi:hypothetical protein
VLEAAHLPGASWRAGADKAEHGILLRLDLHRLFDAGLLRIEDGVVRVAVGSYAALDGTAIARQVGTGKMIRKVGREHKGSLRLRSPSAL